MQSHRHFMLYKPYGFLCQVIHPAAQRNKRVLSELFPFPEGVHPIGRLDEDSEGLLLLTSNSKLMAMVNGSKVEKEYWVQLDGEITEAALQKLSEGVQLIIKKISVRTKPCQVKLLKEEPAFEPRVPAPRAGKHRPYSWISITLNEGKYRQVRKMTAAVGFPTLRLVRVRIDNLWLGDLHVGEVRELPTLIPFGFQIS